ncbi:TetR/AcrR family transcriptional regulator [Mycobacteroides salmoniphilum]|uniref:TetR/AcrR family transcriptional regulator n=1 Tax=Mycobacteroides salmoniphilum TaxID=404941 RepID=UPI001066EF8E|nr:TetR family transcriptional regulator [Mycobacteroides salmoniphilum]TDZ76888.1 putative DNA-binding transcriptional regulator [Mycobacteroides salmoniphilum]TDZ86591.1 putative DNA-binding transcriptional regulator [Mycobacteroides salmoniphilum]
MSTALSHRSPARREKLIAAAITVIAEVGLEKATTRKIAEKAQLPLGSVHYAFVDKDDLINAVIDYVSDQMDALQREALRVRSGTAVRDPAAALHRALTDFWSLVEADEAIQLVLYELTLYCLRRPASRGLAERQYERYTATVREAFFSAFADAGEMSEVVIAEISRLAVAGLDGLILQYLIHRDRDRSRTDLQNLEHSLGLLLNAIAG